MKEVEEEITIDLCEDFNQGREYIARNYRNSISEIDSVIHKLMLHNTQSELLVDLFNTKREFLKELYEIYIKDSLLSSNG